MAPKVLRAQVHWVAYGIAGDRKTLPEGFGDVKDSPDYVGGSGTAGNHDYMGPCPILEHTNHYIFSVYVRSISTARRCSRG